MIPTYDKIMFPLLRLLSDDKEHSIKECRETLAKEFQLTEEEQLKLLPSESTTVFGSRVGWAKTYLLKAGLLHSPKKGRVQITQAGLNALSQSGIENLNNQFLLRYPAFAEFFKGGSNSEEVRKTLTKEIVPESNISPDEALESNSKILKIDIKDKLLERILERDHRFFERLVLDLLKKMGYGASEDSFRNTGGSGDGGIDGIIDEDALGLDKIYIQAKRYDKDATIGRPVIQSFIGAISSNIGAKGVFITTAKFSKEAKEFNSGNTKLVLIDGERLTDLMFKYNLGCSVERIYEVKRIDSDYFEDDDI